LCKSNSNLEYNESSLKKGDLVLFYNPKSSYQKDGRTGSHVAVYLGMDKFNRSVYAEQRGIDSKITTSEQFKNEGWIPKKIILPKKS
jgi:cell wall-associated NlpC family hydrolase